MRPCRLSTKLPEVADLEKSEDPGYQQARDRDAKKPNRLGQTMLTRGIRQQRTGRHGDQVQLNSPQGVQYKRNIQHVKQFVTPATEPRGPSLTEPAEVPCEQMCLQEPTSSPKWEPVQGQLRIRALSSNSCYQGDQGESPDLLRDSVTMSPPNGVCGFQVTLTLIVLYLQFFHLPDRTLLTLLMLFC